MTHKSEENLISLIGNTPLVKLKINTKANIYAKLEYLNPGGSIKDRSALYMIEQAEKNGLRPGGTIIEASSGNQAISVAMIGRIKGYNVIITIPEDTSPEKKKAIASFGVKLIDCPIRKSFTDEGHYFQTAKKLSEEIPNSFMLNQYFNENNMLSHYFSTGKEIYNQIGDKITHFFTAIGSGGTMLGVSKFLKEKNSKIKTFGVYAENSNFGTNYKPKPYNAEGMGINYETPFINRKYIDELISCNDDDTKKAIKILAQENGIICGPSAAAVIGRIMREESLTEKDTVVTIITDSGRAYLTRDLYSDI